MENKETLTSPARLSLVLKVPLRFLRPSIIYSVPCDRIVQRGNLRKTVWIRLAAVGRQYQGGGGDKSGYSSAHPTEANICSDVALMLETSCSFINSCYLYQPEVGYSIDLLCFLVQF